MNLRTRFVILLAGFVVLLAVLTSVIARIVFSNYAQRIDEEAAQETVARCMRYADRLRQEMHGKVQDWAMWDDTYQFMQDRNEEYVDANFVEDTFVSLNLTYVAFFDTDGKLVQSWQYDWSAKEVVDADAEALRMIEEGSPLIARVQKQGTKAGFVSIGDGQWLVGCSPVLTSEGKGPPLGMLLAARHMDDRHREDLAGIVHQSARFVGSGHGGDIAEIRDIARRANMLVERVHLPSLPGKEPVAVELTMVRQALAQSFVNALYLPGWILICGTAITIFMLLLLEQWVVSVLKTSVAGLRAGIESVARGEEETGLRNLSKRPDELGDLATAILNMLGALRQSRDLLSESEALYRGLFESSPQCVLSLTAGGRILAANRRFLELTSTPREAAMNRRLSEAWPGPLAEWIEEKIGSMTAGATTDLADTPVKCGGENHWCTVTITAIGTQDGGPGPFLVLLSDVTRRVLAQQEAEAKRVEMEHAKRLASLGTLVAGVAHEVNNPNGVINLNMNVMRRLLGRLPAPADMSALRLEQLVEETLDASNRITALVASLKSFARPARGSPADSVNVNQLIDKACSWLRSDIEGRRIRLELSCREDLPEVRGSEKELLQVFVNILQNACTATNKPGDAIRIRSWAERDEGMVNVCIEDEGVGIQPEHMDHIFDPFFTTNRDRGGTGLGLSISSAILEAHGGGIKIDSEEAHGTKVTVYIPMRKDKETGDDKSAA